RGSNHVIGDNDPTAHAEVMAIRDACQVLGTYDLSGCEVYTTCYPCPMCLSSIIWSNIKKVYYGNSSLDAADIGFRDDFIYNYIKNKDDNVLELINIDHDETIKEFQEYINSEDKVIY
ncbi:MAG: nucleoside deaminase, partial [Bacilli bacterium]|nr:nucleoside deaminase [Bacilli bacterium]